MVGGRWGRWGFGGVFFGGVLFVGGGALELPVALAFSNRTKDALVEVPGAFVWAAFVSSWRFGSFGFCWRNRRLGMFRAPALCDFMVSRIQSRTAPPGLPQRSGQSQPEVAADIRLLSS